MKQQLINPSKLYKILTGRWSFIRSIPGFSPLLGRANFFPHAKDLFYREELKFPTPSGKMLNASREYLYQFNENNITLHFSAGAKPRGVFMQFHFLENAASHEWQARGEHLCGHDRYRGVFTFTGNGQFWTTYEVRGPRKDYSIHTKLFR